MGTAIRKHIKDFVALIVLVAIALGITLFILSNQNFSLPGWVPILGKDTYSLKAEFSTAQAVTPGQGQTVNIAGVPIGQVSDVQLIDGRAVVTMQVKPKFENRIFPDATMLLRPKTGLKDMVIALDPGSPASGPPLGSGATIPVSHTQPDVNLDEFLSVLDADTRDYLVLLLNGGGQGLVGNGRTLAQVLRRFDPLQRNIAKITSQLQSRQRNMKRVTTSLALLLNELGNKDTNLAAFVESSNRSLSNFAAQEANIKETINLLPGALSATNTAVQNLNTTSLIAGPTLSGLLPAAQGLAAAQSASVKFFNQTQNSAPHVFQNQLRPFAVASQPALRELEPASKNLNAAMPGLIKTVSSINYAVNEMAYDPPGDVPPYLFNLFWAGHDTNAMLGNQDAAGAVRQGVLFAAITGFDLGYKVAHQATCVGNPFLQLTFDLLRTPYIPYTPNHC
jgi:phospholipid/cholesterol/gamma-HCH transport system substrate-binding protein